MTAADNSFPWPRLPGGGQPRWTGHGFEVDGRRHGVLAFAVGASGWSDDLTSFHEEQSSADHPIDLASRRRAVAQLRGRLPPRAAVLEVGCSSGYLLADLRAAFPDAFVIGADYIRGPLEKLAAERPQQPLLQFDLTRCPMPDGCVDAVVALNVLEHIEDDRAAVREMFRIIRPGGVAILELPAGPRLYDVYDKVLMHYRRYAPRQAVAMFRDAGFRVAGHSHIGFFVYPAFAAVKLRNRRWLDKSEAEQRAVVTQEVVATKRSAVMRALMTLEEMCGRHVRYPFGIRCVFTATKPGQCARASG